MKQTLANFTTRDLWVVHWMERMEAAYNELKASGVRHLPVVDDSASIIGILSDRDFYRAMQVEPVDFLTGLMTPPEFDPNARVRDYMTWPVAAIDESRSIADAAREMIDKKISSLVVTRGTQVVGIVTTEDLLRALIGEPEESTFHRAKIEAESALYNSPIGGIAHALANIGI